MIGSVVGSLQNAQVCLNQQQSQWQNQMGAIQTTWLKQAEQAWLTPFIHNYGDYDTLTADKKKPKTFRQELQDDVDVWLKGIG